MERSAAEGRAGPSTASWPCASSAATAIVDWVFGSHGVRQLDDELATGLAWEVFYNAVNQDACPRPGVPTPESPSQHAVHALTQSWQLMAEEGRP